MKRVSAKRRSSRVSAKRRSSSKRVSSSFLKTIQKQVKIMSSGKFLKRIEGEDDTMVKNMDILREINKLGYITNESQAGNKHVGKNKETGKDYKISERAFISGFMLESVAAEFIKNINLYTDKIAQYLPCVDDSVHLPRALDIPLTIQETKNAVEVFTHMAPALPNSVWNMFRKECNISKREKVVFVECYDPKWNRYATGSNGLFTEVLEQLEAISK